MAELLEEPDGLKEWVGMYIVEGGPVPRLDGASVAELLDAFEVAAFTYGRITTEILRAYSARDAARNPLALAAAKQDLDMFEEREGRAEEMANLIRRKLLSLLNQ
jgi:hypothetical protein